MAAATLGRRDSTRPARQRQALAVAAGLTVGHLLVTAVAAPVNFSQRTHTGDPAALARVFDTFERLTAVRTVLQAATLAAMVWALAAATNPRPTRRADRRNRRVLHRACDPNRRADRKQPR